MHASSWTAWTATAAAAALTLAACQPRTAAMDPHVDVVREADAIRSASADRAGEMNDHEADKVVARFAPGATVVWPGAEPVRGALQIRRALSETFKDPAFAVDWKADRVSVSKEGDLAWAGGRYTLTRTDPQSRKPVTTRGAFVETFTKGPDGRWLIAAGVSSGPAPQPAD